MDTIPRILLKYDFSQASRYEYRYLHNKPVESPEEELWRDSERDRLEIKKKIQDHVLKCEWEKPGAPSGYGGLAAQKGYQAIRSYVIKYLESNNSLPSLENFPVKGIKNATGLLCNFVFDSVSSGISSSNI